MTDCMYCGKKAVACYLGDDIELLLCIDHNQILKENGYAALKKCKRIPQMTIDETLAMGGL